VAEGQSHSIRQSGRYPLCGRGDVNTYAIFAEHKRSILGPAGRAGFIVPPGLATDDTTKAYFQDLVAKNALVVLFEFENEEFLFPGIDHRVRFIVITVARARVGNLQADISFGNRNVVSLGEPSRHFSLSPSDFEILNPNTRTCPTFHSRRDADINLAMYRRVGVLWRENDPEGNPWGLRFGAMLHMANDSGLFRTASDLEAAGWQHDGAQYTLTEQRMLPLIEAKMVHHFDHRFGTYEHQTEAQESQGKLPEVDTEAHSDPTQFTRPHYWVAKSEIDDRVPQEWPRDWLLGWRNICRSTDQRTVLVSLFPRVGVAHSMHLLFATAVPRDLAILYGALASIVVDYAARQKVGGTNLTHGYFRQFPVPPPGSFSRIPSWTNTTVCDWILVRVLELTYTAWDLEPFAHDVGYNGPPFRWDPERRFLIRCELDAAFFHLYGLNRDDTDYVMDTFSVVRKNDEKAHNEYRTKRVILEIYDAMAEAIRTGKPYQTRLDPPPADSIVAHPGRREVLSWTTLDLAALPDAAWERPCENVEAESGIAIAAVLKAVARPTPKPFVRLAALLSLEPQLLLASLTNDESKSWRRLVGGEVEPPPTGVTALVPPDDRAWGSAVRRLRGNGLLVENSPAQTWAPGPGLGAIETDGWANSRVRFVLGVLRRRSERDLLQTLSETTRRWIDGAAA
jgi:hypothetical protein